MPSLGLRQPILLAQRAVFRDASPQYKLTPAGFLDYLLNQNKPQILNETIDDRSGYIKDVRVRFKKRWAPGKSVTTDDCSIQGEPAYFEQTLPSTLFRKIAIFFEWKTIETFTEDALAMVNLPNSTPPTRVMQEVIDTFNSALNGLIADIDTDLLALQAAAFGKNAVTGLTAARTINFPADCDQCSLSEGLLLALSDAMENEISLEGASIVGSGLINNFYLRENIAAKDIVTNRPGFFYDPYAKTGWGTNQFGLFERDAVQFVNLCRFRGAAKSGRWGESQFGTLTWPIRDSFGGTGLRTLEFDFQAREVDCPEEQVIGYGTSPVSRGRGLVFDLMCSYFIVNIPSNAYEAADRLTGVNGALRYVATNA